MRVRYLLAPFLALILTAPPAPAQALTPVDLAIGFIPHVQFAPLYLGIEKGYYAEEGIQLRIQYGLGVDIFSLLAARRIDIGLSDSDQLLIAGSKGLDLKAVFQYYQKYPVTVVAKAARVRQPADFAGKTIGTPELFGSSYIGLRIFLDHYGLTDRVRIERTGYTQIPALLADRIDGAVCFFNNEPIQLREMGQNIVQWDVKDISDIVGASFISSGAIISAKRDILTRFARATRKAMAETVRNPAEAFRASLKHIGSVDSSRHAFFHNVLVATNGLFESPAGFGSLDPAKYRKSIDSLVGLGLIPKAFPAERVLSPLVP